MGSAEETASTPFRVLPRLTSGDNEFFWTSGEDGRLRFLRCANCRYIIHPPSPRCARCLSKEVAPEPVSGKAIVVTYTINYQAWIPGFDPPYAVAIVEITEQPGVRLFTNIVNSPLEDVQIGMPVRVTFEHNGDVWIPLFEPDS